MINTMLLKIATEEVITTGVWEVVGPILYTISGGLIFFLIKVIYENITKSSDKSDDIIKERIRGNIKLEEEKNLNIHGRIDENSKKTEKLEDQFTTMFTTMMTKLDGYVVSSEKRITLLETSITNQDKIIDNQEIIIKDNAKRVAQLESQKGELEKNKESDRQAFLGAFSTAMDTLRIGIDDPLVQKDLGNFVDQRFASMIDESIHKAVETYTNKE